jgi:hypothetical protein
MQQVKTYILPFLLLLAFEKVAQSQNYNIYNERTFEKVFDIHTDTTNNFHTAIQPYSQNEFKQISTPYDNILNELEITSSSKFINYLTNNDLIKFKKIGYDNYKTRSFSLNPIINTGLTLEKENTSSQYLTETSLGINISGAFGNKWSGQFVFLADKSKYPSYIDALVQTKNISPGYGYSKNDRSFFAQGNVTFTADKNFTFQAGYGKNFIGDGYRSLLLSDNANSYPYFKVTANIWKLKYMALYTMFQDIRYSDGEVSNYFNKFSTIHYLSYNVNDWLNFGFFESIIFQAQEGNFYRGFDINYLNPIIFLRPVEYAQGSADNALLGGSMKVKIKKKVILYSQLLLDEFLLKELKDGNGWWANKYGVQFGLKSYDFLWIKNLKLQLEYNIVRPFTYSYFYNSSNISTLQNYGHFNSALAHPLGANFKEAVIQLSYHKKRWIFEALSTIAKVGLDTNQSTTIGQDIYKPYNDRTQDYGYFIGNGSNTNIINNTLKITYIINPKSRFTIQGGITNRIYKNDFVDNSSNLFFIGLRTNIINRYTDY